MLSAHNKLFIFASLAGVVYLHSLSVNNTFYFHEAVQPLAAVNFQHRKGFFNVLRWLENLSTVEELDMLVQMMKRMNSSTANAIERFASTSPASVSPATTLTLPAQVSSRSASELIVHLSKVLVQSSLILYLVRMKVIAKRKAIPSMCLCVLVLLCWKMAHTCLQEVLQERVVPTSPLPLTKTSSDASTSTATALRATFLNTLFLLRYAAMTIVNLILGRAYQMYFCEPWPEKWKQIPKYLGSKNLIMSTLFYTTAWVSFMTISTSSLRSLCEAALQIEALALCLSFGHFLFVHLTKNND